METREVIKLIEHENIIWYAVIPLLIIISVLTFFYGILHGYSHWIIFGFFVLSGVVIYCVCDDFKIVMDHKRGDNN